MASVKTLIVMLALSLALASSSAIAQVSISLPWKGSYQPGQFMPVIVTAQGDARDGTIVLSAPGALSTTIAMRGRSEAAVPLLMLTRDAERMSWSLNGSPPHEVDIPLGGPFEIVRSINNPLTWPWDQQLIGLDIAGPNGSIAGGDVYSPTLGWKPGASARMRRLSILSVVLIAIALLACAMLLRGRRVIVGIVVVVAISAAGFTFGQRYISPIWRAEGRIVVVDTNGTAQFDTWQYVTTRSPAETSIELPAGARPVFVDPQHAREVRASLHFDAAKEILSLRCALSPQMKIAILTRRMTKRASPPPPSTQPISRAVKSPMGELARHAYVDRQTRIVDEGSVEWGDDQLVHWASIILWRER